MVSTNYSMPQAKIYNNRTNFGANYCVQIPKKAFKNPDDLKSVRKIFKKAIAKASKDWVPSIITNIAASLGKGKLFSKSAISLETPTYEAIAQYAKENGSSMQWACRNLKIQQLKPKDENYHSFIVHTKEDKDKLLDLMNPKSRKKLLEGAEIYQPSNNITSLADLKQEFKKVVISTLGILGERVSQTMEKDATPTIHFKAESLEELPHVLKQLDY